MIITAKEALAQAKKTSKQPQKAQKKLMRQLKRVEKAINRASIKGKTFISYRCLNSVIYKVLEKNGYEIEQRGNWDYDWIIIHWNKPT